jgi:hypothetical protein
MEKYRIAYVDENPEEIRLFQRYASDDFDVIPLEPPAELENLIEEILESNVLAVISDYNLTEYNKVARYDGVDVITAFLEVKPAFPTFVLTSYDESAADESSDVNMVYTKKVLYESQGMPFKERIRKQIQHYIQRVDAAKAELLTLIEKAREGTLSLLEEERLIDLDNFLEMSINAKCALPKHLKLPSNADKLSEIIESTKLLLSEIRVMKK